MYTNIQIYIFIYIQDTYAQHICTISIHIHIVYICKIRIKKRISIYINTSTYFPLPYARGLINPGEVDRPLHVDMNTCNRAYYIIHLCFRFCIIRWLVLRLGLLYIYMSMLPGRPDLPLPFPFTPYPFTEGLFLQWRNPIGKSITITRRLRGGERESESLKGEGGWIF